MFIVNLDILPFFSVHNALSTIVDMNLMAYFLYTCLSCLVPPLPPLSACPSVLPYLNNCRILEEVSRLSAAPVPILMVSSLLFLVMVLVGFFAIKNDHWLPDHLVLHESFQNLKMHMQLPFRGTTTHISITTEVQNIHLKA